MVWWSWTPCPNGCGMYVIPGSSSDGKCCKGCKVPGWWGRHDEGCCKLGPGGVLPAFVELVGVDGGQRFGVWRVDYMKKCGGVFVVFRDFQENSPKHLRANWAGTVDNDGQVAGTDADWQLLFTPNKVIPDSPPIYTIQAASKKFLSSKDGLLTLSPSLESPGTLWTIHEVRPEDFGPRYGFLHPLRGLLPSKPFLTPSQKRSFREDGFIQLKRVIPESLILHALAHINAGLCALKAVEMEREHVRFLQPLEGHHSITALMYSTPLWSIVQDLIGTDKVAHCGGAQVALRPPQVDIYQSSAEVTKEWAKHWHMDGVGEGRHSDFSLLVGVTLTTALNSDMGNFLVWPGSHKVTCPMLKANHEKGLPLLTNAPDLGPPKQILAAPGDVVLAHQKLAHSGGPNASHSIRYQLYYRVSHKDHSDNASSGLTLQNLWVDFEGLQES
eukprot:TRINITY_DN5590_c0_g2_i1.p1 TRINITY_DN5590_c0_g2~~TRINITY_DN5590_c0_g2_i1.p1  ORF type:complete len:442 (+),score=101.65 TRINITY_DN5590_c0_g2_i1:866-2191(+)